MWLKEGYRNTKSFHGFASFRNRIKRISILFDGDRRLEKEGEICEHVVAYYKELFTKRIGIDHLRQPAICTDL